MNVFDDREDLNFLTNRKPLKKTAVETPFPKWTHYLNGYERPAETKRSKVITERLARSRVYY